MVPVTILSCDRDSGRRPNKKKDREAKLHYITRHAVWPQVADLHITPCAGEDWQGPEHSPAYRTGPIEPIAVYCMSKFQLEPKFWTQQNRGIWLNNVAIFLIIILIFIFQRYLATAISPTSIARNRTKFGTQLPYTISQDWFWLYSEILNFSQLLGLF